MASSCGAYIYHDSRHVALDERLAPVSRVAVVSAGRHLAPSALHANVARGLTPNAWLQFGADMPNLGRAMAGARCALASPVYETGGLLLSYPAERRRRWFQTRLEPRDAHGFPRAHRIDWRIVADLSEVPQQGPPAMGRRHPRGRSGAVIRVERFLVLHADRSVTRLGVPTATAPGCVEELVRARRG